MPKKSLLFCLVFLPYAVFASIRLDQDAHFESIGILPTLDNTEGIYAELFHAAFTQQLKESCLLPVFDLKNYQELISKKASPLIALSDQDVLNKIARSAQVDTLILIQIEKKSQQLNLSLKWIKLNAGFEMLSAVSAKIPLGKQQTHISDQIHEASESLIENMFGSLPFIGYIRAESPQNLIVQVFQKKNAPFLGSHVNFATIVDKKMHPLEKSHPFWQLESIGSVVIDQTEKNMAFAHAFSEGAVSSFAKIIKVEKPSLKTEERLVSAAPISAQSDLLGQWGYASIGGQVGSYALDQSSGILSGVSLGARNEIFLLLKKRYFFTTQIFAHTTTLSGSSQSAFVQTLFEVNAAAGMQYPFDQPFASPKLWAKSIYKNQKTFIVKTSEIGPLKLSGFFLGLGGRLPLLSENHLIEMNSDIFFFGTISPSWMTKAKISSMSAFDFSMSWLWQFSDFFTLQTAVTLSQLSFLTTSGLSVQQNQILFSPSLRYRF